MMRMVVPYLVSSYVKKAKGSTQEPWSLLEQPADPYHKNKEVVSWWRTSQWKALKDEFNFVETTFDQLHLGGENNNKMTTLGGNLPVAIDQFLIHKKVVQGRVHDSKSLSRWAPRMMDAIALALIQHVFNQEPRLAQLSWQDHIQKWPRPTSKRLQSLPGNASIATASSSHQECDLRCLEYRRGWALGTFF